MSYVKFLYVMYYRYYFGNDTHIDTSYDEPSLLKGGMSQLVSEYYGCNTSCTILFLKTCGEDTHRCLYKDYSCLNRWQASRVLVSVLTLYSLLFCNDAPTIR
jgi:hypothetical protein